MSLKQTLFTIVSFPKLKQPVFYLKVILLEVETDDPDEPLLTISVPVDTMEEVQSDQSQPLQQSEAVIAGQSDRPVLQPIQPVETMIGFQIQTEQLVPTVVQQAQHEVVVQSPSSLSGTDLGPCRALAKSVFMDICGVLRTYQGHDSQEQKTQS